jgi:hypothetical protein
MGAPRNLAAAMLRAALRFVPEGSREWAAAMLRELDYIPGDWAALSWALGSIFAVFRHAMQGWRARLTNRTNKKEEQMNEKGKKAIGFVSGILAAFGVVLCAFGVQLLLEYLFPALRQDHPGMTHVITVMIVPQVLFVAAAILMWRKRAALVAGMLLFALAADVHIAIFFATH